MRLAYPQRAIIRCTIRTTHHGTETGYVGVDGSGKRRPEYSSARQGHGLTKAWKREDIFRPRGYGYGEVAVRG